MFTRIVLLGMLSLISTQALAAGKCSWVVTRTSCGNNNEQAPDDATKASFAKCSGKAKCDPVNKMVADEAACLVAAVDACTNSRFKETKSKTNKVEFNGKVISEDACGKDSAPKFIRKEHFDRCKD